MMGSLNHAHVVFRSSAPFELFRGDSFNACGSGLHSLHWKNGQGEVGVGRWIERVELLV